MQATRRNGGENDGPLEKRDKDGNIIGEDLGSKKLPGGAYVAPVVN